MHRGILTKWLNGRCSFELLQDLIQQFRVLGNVSQDDRSAIRIGHRIERIIRVVAVLDVGQFRMHIVGGILGAVLGNMAWHPAKRV